jgi:hypothetical protein
VLGKKLADNTGKNLVAKPLTGAQEQISIMIFTRLKEGLEKMRAEKVPFAPFQWIIENSKEDIALLSDGLGKSLMFEKGAGFQNMAVNKYYPRELLTSLEGGLIEKKLDYCAVVLVSYDTMAEKINADGPGGLQVFARYKITPMLPKLVLGSIFEYHTEYAFVPAQNMKIVCDNLVRLGKTDDNTPKEMADSLEAAIATIKSLAEKSNFSALLGKMAAFPGNAMRWLADEMALR